MGLTGEPSWPGLHPSPGHAGSPVGSGQQAGETQLHAGETLPHERVNICSDMRMRGGSKASAAEWGGSGTQGNPLMALRAGHMLDT